MRDLEEPTAPPVQDRAPAALADPATAVARQVLAGLSGSVALLQAEYGRGGQVTDFRFIAASPEAVDIAGRRGPELVGLTVLGAYPGVAGTTLWRGYLQALHTGTGWEGELEYEEAAAGIPRLSRYRVRATPCHGGLVVTWERLDTREREQRRLALMQRVARMGWVDRDLVRGGITWSDEVYSIFGRDRALGPLALEHLAARAEIEDRPALTEAVRLLLKAGEPLDHTFRIRLQPGPVRHVRIVAETETDAHGHPIQIHGFFQDLTAAKETEQQLLEQEQKALAQQGLLAAERELAHRLQETVLPVPEQLLHLNDLTVDVVYQPVQEGLKLGGDWYSAIELPDGSALLVVGDVAGHGLDAVATMALLRFTAKGMAVTGTPLPAVLSRLNTLLLHTSDRSCNTATMIMAIYQPATSLLTWVQAGHPPPLLVRDGESRFLPTPAGILLGAATAPVYQETRLHLLPGDHLYLYTDGLVENPAEPIDVGLARLAAAAPAHAESRTRLAGLVQSLTDPMTRRDDICVLHISH
ncbi:serine/threonine protein phosphatase [Streptomyces tateyamensis]|uniref:Serine/threonine protein phosphatase n=1 Tax=Streptomyces tateyamensis TaxID=565073 RepID=A0A2V4PN01_9ACTN|nr:SpoIIE family protein phosphatase [Streptomyces tateyamensis]PYC87616.1 serine/threonine protein phosphatase [Streptomyces tateyamensis]